MYELVESTNQSVLIMVRVNKYDLHLSEIKEMVRIQFPAWAHLPIKKIKTSGTINAIYRLGENYCIRIPKIHSGVEQIKKEAKWLNVMARQLPLRISNPIAVGASCPAFPWKWAVYEWIEGQTATRDIMSDMTKNIDILSGFIQALQKVDTSGGPEPGEHNYNRGEPLIKRDTKTRKAFFELKDQINIKMAERVWDEALDNPLEGGEKTWIHGDLQPGNILVENGEIRAIIDFGALAVGDRACDLMPAWNLFDAKERKIFREKMKVNDAVWSRGRGWALSFAVIAYEHYTNKNRELARISNYIIEEIEKEYSF